MKEKIKKELHEEIFGGANTAFVDSNFQSNLAYRPQFLYNDNKNKKKVLSSLEAELKHCSEFIMSVAFLALPVLEKICAELECNIGDIMEFTELEEVKKKIYTEQISPENGTTNMRL